MSPCFEPCRFLACPESRLTEVLIEIQRPNLGVNSNRLSRTRGKSEENYKVKAKGTQKVSWKGSSHQSKRTPSPAPLPLDIGMPVFLLISTHPCVSPEASAGSGTACFRLRVKRVEIRTKNNGMKIRSMNVAESMPPVTAVPMAFIAPAPAPVATAKRQRAEEEGQRGHDHRTESDPHGRKVASTSPSPCRRCSLMN